MEPTTEQLFTDLRQVLLNNPTTREIALALTKLDECEMWAKKAGVQ